MPKPKKIAVFCTNLHHEEKSLLLKKNFTNVINIFNKEFDLLGDVNIQKNMNISEVIDNHEAFIFFTLLPNIWTLRLVEKIKASKKTIIAFQESHQLSMHDNEVNNLIFRPDLIIAASNQEKERLELIWHDKNLKIASFGWIFNTSKLDSPKALQSNLRNLTNSILLILSAPKNLTFSSYETMSIRKKLVYSILKNYPNHDLKIKLHPNEKVSEFYALLDSLDLNDRKVTIIESKDDYFETIENAKLIFVSNRTQALFDVINSGKVHLYLIGKENFISKYALALSNAVNNNGLRFIKLINQESIKKFNEEFINQNTANISEIETLISNQNFSNEYDHGLEIKLWKIVLKRITLKKFLSANIAKELLQKETKGLNVQYPLSDYFSKENLSIRTALFIIITRVGFQNNLWKEKNFIHIIENNLNNWFIQYFVYDAIYIFYQCKVHNMHLDLNERCAELLEHAIINLRTGSKLFHYLIKMLDYSCKSKNKLVKNFFFNIGIRFLGAIRYLSN